MDAEPRARGSSSPSSPPRSAASGTGLGLSTVYGIVKQSQGHIWVDSELGRGARFEIYLPRVEERVDRRDRHARPRAHPEAARRCSSSKTKSCVRVAARRILEQHGYRVLEAGNGREAMRLCEEHPQPIGLLITDIVMPEMNGRELARQITAQRPNMKVIYVSGYADETLDQGDEEPFAGYMQKPFSPETLLKAVRERLG